MKNINKTRYYFIEEISLYEVMSNNRKTIHTTPMYIEHLIILIIPIGFNSSTVGIKVFAITIGIKRYKSISK